MQEEDILKNPFYLEQVYMLFNNSENIPEKLNLLFNEIVKKYDKTLKDLLQQEMDESAADNLLIMNLFVSLKKMTKTEISLFYAKISFTERVLISENAGMYVKMYENNKNNYRSKIIQNAKKHHINEYQYTLGIVEQANKSNRHLGWKLLKPKKYKERSYAYIIIVVLLTLFASALLSYYAGVWAFLLLLVPLSQFVIDIFNQLLYFPS
jgi:hypothetical protein